jgi:hypothetical protein
MRKSDAILSLLALGLVLVLLSLVDAKVGNGHAPARLASARGLVAELGLTDLCLFTEARYTRHLSQADLHAPFQDHPLALEHFPSGSLVAPPESLLRWYDELRRATALSD